MTRLWNWGPVLLVMAVIFGASAMSDPGPPPAGMSDKGAHVLAYAVLGATLIRALAGGRFGLMTAGRIALAAALAGLYGVTDEYHQRFVPGRHPDPLDVVADVCGGTAGAILYAVGARRISGLRGRRHASGRAP